MQVFGNVATQPERKVSKSTGKGYYEFRIAESQKGADSSPTWFTVRRMHDEDPQLSKGDFTRVTGKLKADYYLSREGKPTGTLLIIAFEATKISKPTAAPDKPEVDDSKSVQEARKEPTKALIKTPEPVPAQHPALQTQAGTWADWLLS
jgi:hypothetical protein